MKVGVGRDPIVVGLTAAANVAGGAMSVMPVAVRAHGVAVDGVPSVVATPTVNGNRGRGINPLKVRRLKLVPRHRHVSIVIARLAVTVRPEVARGRHRAHVQSRAMVEVSRVVAVVTSVAMTGVIEVIPDVIIRVTNIIRVPPGRVSSHAMSEVTAVLVREGRRRGTNVDVMRHRGGSRRQLLARAWDKRFRSFSRNSLALSRSE